MPVAKKKARPASARPRATLYRDEVDQVVKDGLGAFLQRVAVGPSLREGRFFGFRVLALSPPEFWSSVDLKPGDVVMSVNGMPIERPIQAHEAFSSLTTADRLVVTLVRQGQTRELSYQIRSRASAPAAAPKPPAAQPPAAQPPAHSDS
jgi:type II secretory pathway component PulC